MDNRTATVATVVGTTVQSAEWRPKWHRLQGLCGVQSQNTEGLFIDRAALFDFIVSQYK